ncbi:nucleotidyltransferase domain-containing protein [Alkalimonas sp. MEB108]|uniref:Nucleotidyltransferase domain-containing protein n=1 Tax=Alkalimonas cellulosilytica TaxID=3058395 RepID=A0ABU7J314_9GAMM|nr:nucleotidyltransferase domain-containing protein [Alkalimonas sp. MEB108]MEE2000894.1 nucleotidyltransferase domain-containing protein [Alkalimonas sp. MEB108]
MRLTTEQIKHIKSVVADELGEKATVTLFGSRQQNEKRGGDIDLLVSSTMVIEQPALIAARLEAKIMQRIGLQKVDVLLSAPNLQHFPIHAIAANGTPL